MEPSPTGFDSSVHGMTAADRTLEGAAPKVVASQRAKAAATYPVHIYLQLEFLARESADSVVRFFARSLLIVALTSVRACEWDARNDGGRLHATRPQ